MSRYAATVVVGLAALALMTAAIAPAAETKKPVKVFILAGQSNMQGHALLRTLDHLGNDPKYGQLLKKLKAPDGSYTVRDDVWIYYERGKGGAKKGPLTAGYGCDEAMKTMCK